MANNHSETMTTTPDSLEANTPQEMTAETPLYDIEHPQTETNNNLWQKVKKVGNTCYDLVKKYYSPVKHIDDAIHSKDPVEITTTFLNEGGKIIGGKIGKTMRIPHAIKNIANSETNGDAISKTITTIRQHADFGEQGNKFAQELSNGFSAAGKQDRIEQKIQNNINNNIEKARQEYDFNEKLKKGEYIKQTSALLKNIQPRGIQPNTEELSPNQTTIMKEDIPAIQSNSEKLQPDTSQETYHHESNNTFQNGQNSIEEHQQNQATMIKEDTSSIQNNSEEHPSDSPQKTYLHEVDNILQDGHNRIEEIRNRIKEGQPLATQNTNTIKDKRARLNELRFATARPKVQKHTSQTSRSDMLRQLYQKQNMALRS